MFFEKQGIWMPRKFAKFVRIFEHIENPKNQRVTFWPGRIGLVFHTVLSGYNDGYNS